MPVAELKAVIKMDSIAAPITKSNKRFVTTGIILGLPVLFALYLLIASPGYVMPFFHFPVCILLTVAGTLWALGGAAIAFYTEYRLWKTFILPLVFSTPLTAVLLLGPAILTIMMATGPIFTTK